jgi:hypothetical protein
MSTTAASDQAQTTQQDPEVLRDPFGVLWSIGGPADTD